MYLNCSADTSDLHSDSEAMSASNTAGTDTEGTDAGASAGAEDKAEEAEAGADVDDHSSSSSSRTPPARSFDGGVVSSVLGVFRQATGDCVT
jgi:hypothetical protein